MSDLIVGFVAPVSSICGCRRHDCVICDRRRCECADCRPRRGVVVLETKPKSVNEGPGWVEIGGGK